MPDSGAMTDVKILLVSMYFPPLNAMGALRIGKLAKHLVARGHDVRVVAGRHPPSPEALPLELPAERVTYTSSLDIHALASLARVFRFGSGDHATAPLLPVGGAAPRQPGWKRALGRAYHAGLALAAWPDSRIGWMPYALSGARRVLLGWRPDVIFASAPPFTGLLVARRLARRFAIPWVAEYRDRWIEDSYSPPPRWRRWIETRQENAALRSAAGIVTVSEPWAEDYRRRWGKPTAVVYNGYDPDDFPPQGPPASAPETLHIVYTGILYPERRDPSPLFAAIAQLGAASRRVRVDFYGADRATLHRMIARHGVADRVGVHDRVPYRDSLALQSRADVLLLLQWNDARERGNVPGKLFEYLAARRPVLALGLADGVPARILAERGAGRVINDPGAIADQLTAWIAEKRALGAIPLLPAAVAAGLSRAEQYDVLIGFLEDRIAEAEARSARGTAFAGHLRA